jgi:hypothetical protein
MEKFQLDYDAELNGSCFKKKRHKKKAVSMEGAFL